MTVLKDVLVQLFGMFLGDSRLSAAILAVVAVAALAIDPVGLPPLLGGGLLLVGCLGIVIAAVLRTARTKRAAKTAPRV